MADALAAARGEAPTPTPARTGLPATAAEWVLAWDRVVDQQRQAQAGAGRQQQDGAPSSGGEGGSDGEEKEEEDLSVLSGEGHRYHDPTGSNCYRPVDLQSMRAGVDFAPAAPNLHPSASPADRAAAAQADADLLERDGWIVGVVEEYARSYCVLTLLAFGQLPAACNCTGVHTGEAVALGGVGGVARLRELEARLQVHHETHDGIMLDLAERMLAQRSEGGAPSTLGGKALEAGRVSALVAADTKRRSALTVEAGASTEVEAAARRLTARDARLYAAGRALYARQLERAQRAYGFIMC